MAEKPILFSGPMVRAILDGKKTQTRRVIKPQPGWLDEVTKTKQGPGPFFWPIGALDQQCGLPIFSDGRKDGEYGIKCPYQPGDLLWVKETHAFISIYGVERSVSEATSRRHKTTVIYQASPPWLYEVDREDAVFDEDSPMGRMEIVKHEALCPRWKPPRFMPRWASRLTLEIVSVRVERLQKTSYDDAVAEGMEVFLKPTKPEGISCYYEVGTMCCDYPQDAFHHLWDSINGKKHPWDNNPWVWVIEFKVVQP